MDGANELDARLQKLRESGWDLSTRRVYTLKRRGQLHSFHGEELEDVVRRAEASETGAAKRLKPPTEREDDTSGAQRAAGRAAARAGMEFHNHGSPR
jgi:hypothetical protein